MSEALDALYTEIEKVRLHHGSDAKFTPAKFKPSKKGLHGPGWYATPKLRTAGAIYGRNVHSFSVRGKFASKDRYDKRLAERGGVHSVARRSLRREGYVGVKDKASGNHSVWSRGSMHGHKTGQYQSGKRPRVIPDGPRGPKARRVRKSTSTQDLYAAIAKARVLIQDAA